MQAYEHIAALDREGALLAAAAGRAGLDAPVPDCPPWRVADLLRHLGFVHRWAAGYVAGARREMIDEPSEDELLRAGPGDEELLSWFRDGHRALVDTLRSAGPGLDCWTVFPAPSPLQFWARRQAHETAVHRVDAESAAGKATPLDAAFAADGIDELLTGFAPRAKFRAPADRRRSLGVRATDTGDEWLAEIGAGIVARRGGGPADCVAAGPASQLYLLLWNRPQPGRPGARPIVVSGDAGILELWLARVRVTWE